MVADHLLVHFKTIGELCPRLSMIQTDSAVRVRRDTDEPGSNYVVSMGVPSDSECGRLLEGPDVVWFGDRLVPELQDQLEKFGLSHFGPLTGLARKTGASSPVNGDVRLVSQPDDYALWCEVFSTVWHRNEEVVSQFFSGLFAWQGADFVLSFVDDRPVGASVFAYHGEVAGHYWDVVLEPYRGQGIGTNMINYRLNLAYNLGLTHSVAHCLDSSRGCYEKCGFDPVLKMALFK